ncbi:hypothetical protein ABT301_29675 [Streptomyces sp. NPDC000987]|uniref:hypothetical protein n=1 Tax=Streptomyces sp. NPDC000987 TaxID=3154374 RepID=UPI003323B305
MDVSTEPGNTVTIDPDGGLYVPPPTVKAGCGITGDGSETDPLTANTQDWPYVCPIGTNGGGVYCDTGTGELRTDPPVRQDFFQNAKNDVLATPITVPAVAEQTVDTLTFTVTNPDPCRPANAVFFREVDLDVNLPPNSGATTGIDGDQMTYLGNQGSGTVFATHVQANKITLLALAPGETRTITMRIEAGRGTGGAAIIRIQATLRAWVFSNPIG